MTPRTTFLRYITDAAQLGLYTIITMVYVPNNAYFRDVMNKEPAEPLWASSWNKEFVSLAGQ